VATTAKPSAIPSHRRSRRLVTAATTASIIFSSSAVSVAPVAAADPANVVFQVTGTGEVYSIVTDPDSGQVPDHTTTPWSRTLSVPADVGMLQVVATSRGAPMGCRITLNGAVVAEKAPGGDAHCIWTRP
jgi:hypothetical protein